MDDPLNGTTFDAQMQLYTQFYLARLMLYDNFEEFAAIRRTGYSILTPPNFLGNFTGGKALVRL